MGASFNVNNKEVIAFTAKLEKLNRSAFPSAVRNTLNNAAFQAKKNVPNVAQSLFVTRQKSFFKRFSTVDKAVGFSIDKMRSTVGISSAYNAVLAENLESQEFGGMVQGKKLIPHDDARVSRSQNKRVQSKNFHPKVQAHNASRAFRNAKGTRSSRFVSAVMSTVKSGKKYMLLQSGEKGMLYELTSVSSNVKSKKLNFKLKKLYSVRSKTTNKVKSTGFMKKSVNLAAKDMEKFYKQNAEFQFKKALR